MRIHITSEHIRRGKRRNTISCPIALALKEKYYDAYVATNFMQIREQKGDYWQKLRYSRAVKTFIQKFDAGEEVSPFSFISKAKKEL